MKPIFLGGRQITSKQTNIMLATDKDYGKTKQNKTRKEIRRAAGCAVVDIPGRLHQGVGRHLNGI